MEIVMKVESFVMGLDVGGANIKLATSKGDGQSVPFELWRSPDLLGARLRELAGRYQLPDRLAVTMSGELCDCFRTKRDGVTQILQGVAAGWPELLATQVGVWSTEGKFVTVEEAVKNPLGVSAGNWHAQGTALARRYGGRSLMIDTGSTTTDILWLEGGVCRAVGKTDTARLGTGELVYLGAGRTPLMALGPLVEFRGKSHGVMNELFADMRDVWLVMGLKPEEPDAVDTWDKRPATRVFAAERVLRMVGADSESADVFDSSALAHTFAMSHAHRIAAGVRRVIAGRRPERVILTGSGDFAAGFAVDRVESLEGIMRVKLGETIGAELSDAACAWAVVELMRSTA
jgi:(4-(4-[2-(gamma-L-glutamylamino)ethyl]phenoxymethyl)furan-2-yl)methanamine synthase